MINIIKIKIPKQIILLTILVIVLIIARIFIFDSFSLIYILWNIFLALLPFLISSFLLQQNRKQKLKKWLLIVGGIIWLLLLPNAPYLVTDLIHVGVVYKVPALYDSILLFSSAWVGMLLWLHSLFHMEQIIRTKCSGRRVNMIISGILLLTAFGMYLGRFLRFNSWDIVINHSSILKSTWNMLSQSGDYLNAYLYIALFFVFLMFSYFSWKTTQVK